jgi:hypothetical protein
MLMQLLHQLHKVAVNPQWRPTVFERRFQHMKQEWEKTTKQNRNTAQSTRNSDRNEQTETAD